MRNKEKDVLETLDCLAKLSWHQLPGGVRFWSRAYGNLYLQLFRTKKDMSYLTKEDNKKW